MSEIQEVKKKEKVCIVGCSDSKSETPFHLKDEFEFWGVNNLFLTMPAPWSRWFEIHQITCEGGKWLRRGKEDFRGQSVPEYLQQLGKLPFPVYCQQPNPFMPNAVAFPFQQIIDRFGTYFTNTISWQIAYAILEDFKEIRIYGVDMAVDCLSPDSKVLTADLRWVPCGDVKVGDELMGFDEFPSDGDGKTRRWRKTRVTKAREVMKPCYEVGLDDGTSFIASEKHGWLTHGENVNRWKTTDQLVSKHHRTGRPTRILKMVNPWREDTSWEAGYLAAAFDGEGCLCQTPRKGMNGVYTNQLAFAQRQNPMKDTVRRILDDYGFRHTVTSVNKSDTHQVNIQGGKPEIMRFLGQIRPHRLLPKFKAEAMGEFQAMKYVPVVETRHIGMHPVIGIETDAKTFIADGFSSHNSEYFWQRPSCEYFLGLAVGMGIKIWLPDTCDLLKTRFMYGYEEAKELPFRAKIESMKKSMQKRANQAQAQMAHHEKQVQQYIGAMSAVNEIDKIWKNVTGG
jgi:hypothetical protein